MKLLTFTLTTTVDPPRGLTEGPYSVPLSQGPPRPAHSRAQWFSTHDATTQSLMPTQLTPERSARRAAVGA